MKKKKKVPSEKPVCPIENVLRKIALYIHNGEAIKLASAEKILFDNLIISELNDISTPLSNGRKREIINLFIIMLDNQQISKAVGWLFKHRIEDTFPVVNKKIKTPIDDIFINMIKEVIWVTYYFYVKPANRFIMVGSTQDIICRMQNVHHLLRYPANLFNINRNDYIENILSLKDARYPLLAHPEHIDPNDLESLLIENDAMTGELFYVIRSLIHAQYSPYERYHIFEFIRTIVIEKLQEKINATST